MFLYLGGNPFGRGCFQRLLALFPHVKLREGPVLGYRHFFFLIEVKFIYHNSHHVKKKNPVAYSIFTVCNYHFNLVPECSHLPQRKPQAHQTVTVSPTLCHPPATANLLFVSRDFCILEISRHRNHTVCGLLWLASFTQPRVFEVRPRGSRRQGFVPFQG